MKDTKSINIDLLPIGYCEISVFKKANKTYFFKIITANKYFRDLTGSKDEEDKQSILCPELENELFTQSKLKAYYNVSVNNSFMEFQQYCSFLNKNTLVKVNALGKNQVSICFETLAKRRLAGTRDSLHTNFSKLVDNSFDYLILLDKNFEIIYCNNNSKELLGIKEITSDMGSAFKYVHPDDSHIGQQAIDEVIKDPNKIFAGKIRIKTVDKQYKIMNFRFKNLLSIEGIEGFVINARDMSNIEDSKKIIKENTNYLESLFSAIPNLIFVMDYDGFFIDIKGPNNDLLAYPPNQVLGKNISNLFPPYIANKLRARLSLLKENKPVDTFTYQRKNHLGENRHYECRLSVIDNDKALAIVNDITTLKEAEKALKNNQVTLQRKLNSITSPQGSLSDLELADLINIDELKDLFQTIYDLTNVPIALLDRHGKKLFAIGTSSLCKNFHLNKASSQEWCLESNMKISSSMRIGESKLYKCRNNVWNFATPIFVGGEQIATLDICQFRLSDDYKAQDEELRQLANIHKFNKETYIESFYLLPIIDKDHLVKIATYYRDLLSKITALSYAQIKQARTSQQLQLREEKLAQITDNMTDIIFINDFDFNVIYVSPSVEKVYGFNPIEYSKRTPIQRFPPATINQLQSLLEEKLKSGHQDTESVLVEIQEYNANNQLIDISVHAKLLLNENNEPKAIIGSARDISKRKKIEKKLNKQLELQSLFSSLAMKYINLPLDEISKHILQSLKEFAEYTHSDRAFIFKYDWDKGLVSNTYEWCKEGIKPVIGILQDISVDYLNSWHQAHKKGQVVIINDSSKIIDDEETKKFIEKQDIKSTITVPLMDKDECVGFVGFDSVLSTHQYSEDDETLLRIFAHMLVNVRNRISMAEELQKEKERALESDKLKSNLLKNISHEFRTPLNGIIGLSEQLKDNQLEKESQKMANMIYTSGIRLNYVLDSIMLLSQLESLSETKFINLESTNLSILLINIAKLYKSQVQQKGLDFLIDIQPNLVTMINENLFKQAFIHILNNAIKYTSKGFIKIYTETSKDKKYVSLNIEDSGIGIPEDSQELIFSDFRQVSEGYNRAYEGCGLGLPIAKKGIELMNGTISLVSQFHKGTKLIISLPLVDTYKSINPESSNPLPLKTQVSNIIDDDEKLLSLLIVEDNKINQKLAISILKGRYNIDCAYNGESAIDLIAKKQYDIILMDIHLGEGLDGIETTKIIRNDSRYRKTPIIAVTGYTMLGDKEHILNQGCSHYLSKPYSKQDLLGIIDEALHENLI